jgi:uncharacterized protein
MADFSLLFLTDAAEKRIACCCTSTYARTNMQIEHLIVEFEDGRTDLLGLLLEAGIPANFQNPHGVSLMQTSAYYGNVSAVRGQLARGASLQEPGPNMGLSAACFYGHWRRCLLLLDHGAEVNDQSAVTKETPLHSALCSTDRSLYDRVVEVLLSRGANPNLPAADGAGTEAFIRDARTKGETALHRAAAFGGEATVKMPLGAGAKREVRDAHSDTPLSWASWYLRPATILSQLCFRDYRVNPSRKTMRENLIGFPHKAQRA